MPELRDALRNETRDAHEKVDGAFGSLNLAEREDYQRFLAAHYIATAPLQPILAGFTARELGRTEPDFTAMLHSDLSALGVDPDALPRIDPPANIDPRAVTYVIAGSRLGLSMLRRQPYWGKAEGISSSYMEDGEGMVLWKSLLGWFAEQKADQAEIEAVCGAARQCFTVFERAFAMSASVQR